jgi:hypothetical protein
LEDQGRVLAVPGLPRDPFKIGQLGKASAC